MFANSGVAGIGEQVAAVSINHEPSGKLALDDLGAGAAAQGRWQWFDVSVGAAGGSPESGGLGVGEFGLGFIVGSVV